MTTTQAHSDKIGVLFVCHANMCRSPLAEGIFVHHATARGVAERFHVDSAGTWAFDGVAPHRGSIAVARTRGIDLEALCRKSRPLVPEDLQRFEHIIVMDRANRDDVLRLRRESIFSPGGAWDKFGVVDGPQARVRLLREVADPGCRGAEADVPDPVRGGPEHFDRAYGIIEAATLCLLDELTRPGSVT